MKYRFLLISLIGIIFLSCLNEDMEIPGGNTSKHDILKLFITTPDELQMENELRASHDGPNANDSSIKSLRILVFEGPEETDKLLEIQSVTYTTTEGVKIDGEVGLTSESDANTTLRFLANMNVDGVNVGQTWGDIRQMIFVIDNGASQSFPMTAQLQSNFRTQSSIGTPTERVRLIRSMAKITVTIQSSADFEYIGNRIFNIKNQGFVFPVDENDAPESATTYNEKDYNKNTVTYTPERLNTSTEPDGTIKPLDNRSFFIVRGKYKGHEGYYRIDFYNEATKKFLDFERNTNYNFRVTVNGFGYHTEEEAISHPMNGGTIVHVIADINDAYNFITNGEGNFLGFSNVAVTIYGKPTYYTKGFSGNKTRYEYVLTTITNEKAGGWQASDIVIVNGGRIINPHIAVVDKYDQLGKPVPGMKEYLLVGSLPDDFKVGDETHVTIKYNTLGKEIKVRREQYIDCHFTHISYSGGVSSQSFSDVRLTQSRKSDGGYIVNRVFPKNSPTHLSWAMLYSGQNEGNARSTDYQSRTAIDQWVNENKGSVKIRFHEHLNGSMMGRFAATNAAFEGSRFADVYATARNNGERHKLILVQANADLVGFFGHENLRPNYQDLRNKGWAMSGNYGPDTDQYDQYLVVERITDTYRKDNLASSIEEYCRSHSPSDIDNLWYAPTYSQLLGVWVADNSNSRRISPFQTDEMTEKGSLIYPYFGRSIFKSFHVSAYTRISETLPPLFSEKNVPFVSFLHGETQRGYQAKNYIGVRCVRNMGKDMEPEGLTNTTSPVNRDRIVTMDPKEFLSEDYFSNDSWNSPAIRNNKVARSFQVDRDYLTTQGIFRYTRSRSDSYTTSLEKDAEGEATYSSSISEAASKGKRLPTMRELNLMFIYKDYLERTPAFKKFNIDKPDASGIEHNNPSAKYPRIMRYPAVTDGFDAPAYFYWSSTLRHATKTYPMRISMDMGMVNTRGDGPDQDSQVDHRRLVKTVSEKY